MSRKFLFFIFILFLNVSCEHGEENVFVPSTEWKEIKEGQKIPPGLHIRINLQTGKKEAKLPDQMTNKEKAALISTDQPDASFQSPVSFEELQKTLKKIKNDDNDPKKFRMNFRSYDELKKELGSLNLTPKLDSEVIRDLIEEYVDERSGDKNKTKIKNILEDLDYLSHQIDNALEFVSQNGFKKVVYDALNDTNVEVKGMSLRLLSSLMQNNPKVQIHGLETGCIVEILKILSLEKYISLKYQAVGALSSILRRFPLAQKRFIENGGLSVISNVFQENDTKMNVKIITLIIDLISEHQHLKINVDNEEALKQYELINLEEKLKEHQWCENVNKLLFTLVKTDEDNHDFIEKCLRSMKILFQNCASTYDVKILNYLLQKYNKLGLEDIDEDEENSLSSYFSELKDLCDTLIKTNKKIDKTEL